MCFVSENLNTFWVMKQVLKISTFLLFVAFASCKRGEIREHGPQTPALPVIAVDNFNLESFDSYPASIEGTQNIAIRAKINGYISKVYVDEGAYVKKGTPLFKLETRSLSQDANAAKASIETAQLEVDKLIPLVENNIVSKIQLATAKANLAQAKSRYQAILANIEYTKIKSPVDGIVGSINFRKGALVSPSTQKELTMVSNIKEVYAFFYLNEKDFISLSKNTEGDDLNAKILNLPAVNLQLADGSIYPYEGKIETIAGAVEKSTGTVKVRATFPNTENLLRNGNSGSIRIPKQYSNVLAIPLESTYEIQGKKHVYVVAEDNTLKGKVVTLLSEVGRYVILKGGLKKGDRILGKGINKVYPGIKIQPIPSTTNDIINSFQTTFE